MKVSRRAIDRITTDRAIGPAAPSSADTAGTPNETTAYDFGVGGTIGTNLFSNDLLAETQFPDPGTGYAGTSSSAQQTYGYSLLGDTLSFTDQNGTTHTYTLDRLGRETADAVTTLGAGVDGAVRRLTYSFNDAGLPYQQTSYSAASGGSVVNQEEDIYNGLWQLITQYQAAGGGCTSVHARIFLRFRPTAGPRGRRA
ncbi:MAG TPA: hypothetical protein VHY37_03820 [Tepidisphaeraceae bacterium]|nr:hypothetical protein [Tepidisphaeraceae bacterium]